MNSLAVEWVAKAEGDFNSAERELRARKLPNYDAACFHAQQRTPFRPIHDLEVLLGLITPDSPDFDFIRDVLLLLNDYAVSFRYPGESATKDEARAAVKAMRAARTFARQKLGLCKE